MNYKAELRGFALDRAIKAAELTGVAVRLSDLKSDADEIVDYLYIPEKDIDSHLQTLMPLIAKANDIEKLRDLILQLQQFEAEMAAGIKGAN